jgi:hypothetical protein
LKYDTSAATTITAITATNAAAIISDHTQF